MKILILTAFFVGSAVAQCGSNGKLIFNPVSRMFDCTGLPGAGTGTVTSVGLAGTSRQITVTGASPITDSGSWTLSVPVGFLLVAADGTDPSLNIPDGTAPGTPATGDIWAESGVFKTPNSWQMGVGSSAAGYIGLTQGSAPSAGTTNITLYAPAAVTSYKRRFAGAAFTGVTLWTNTAGDMVETGLTTSGSGTALCLTVSCVMTTPNIGVATATSVNGTSIPSSQTLATLAVTQTFSGDKTFTGLFNAGGATRTAPLMIGTVAALPATCTVGDMYFASNATAGQNAYFCTATDTWTQQLNSGGGGTGCVPSGGSAGDFLVNDGAGGCTVISLLNRSTNTIAGAAALTFDLGASTLFKVPTAAGLAPTADGQLAYDTTSDRLGVGNSGANNPLVVAASTDTFTNKTYDAEATGNVLTIPFQIPWRPAVCQNTTASLGFSTPTSNPAAATCATGSNTQQATADFADGASTLSVQDHFPFPTGFTGAVDLDITWRTSATSGDVVWQVATICVADGETGDPAFNTASTVTDTAKGTTLQYNTATISGVTATGCAANEEFYFRFFRDPANGSDTLAATASLISLRWTIRRAM